METQLKTRNPKLAPLSAEHRSGFEFVGQLRKSFGSIPVDRIRDYTRWYWKNHIKPHFYQEEKILLPYLPEGHPLASRLKDEHQYIRNLVLELDKGGDISLFCRFCDLLVEHINFEEEIFFSWFEQNLDSLQLTAISKELESHPISEIKWDDAFWVSL